MPTLTVAYTAVYADPGDSQPVALFINADDAAHFLRGHFIDDAVAAGKPATAVLSALTISWTSAAGTATNSDAANEVDPTPPANNG